MKALVEVIMCWENKKWSKETVLVEMPKDSDYLTRILIEYYLLLEAEKVIGDVTLCVHKTLLSYTTCEDIIANSGLDCTQ